MKVVDFVAARPSDQQLYDLSVLLIGGDGAQHVLVLEGSTMFSDGVRIPRSVDFVEELAAHIGGRIVFDHP